MMTWNDYLQKLEKGETKKPSHVALETLARIEDEELRVQLLHELLVVEELIEDATDWISADWIYELSQILAKIYGTIARQLEGDFPPIDYKLRV